MSKTIVSVEVPVEDGDLSLLQKILALLDGDAPKRRRRASKGEPEDDYEEADEEDEEEEAPKRNSRRKATKKKATARKATKKRATKKTSSRRSKVGKYGVKELHDAAQELVELTDSRTVRAVWREFGYVKMSEVKPEDYDEIVERLRELIEEHSEEE